jgi:hypothetical protein
MEFVSICELVVSKKAFLILGERRVGLPPLDSSGGKELLAPKASLSVGEAKSSDFVEMRRPLRG